jgi:hypothetical protein
MRLTLRKDLSLNPHRHISYRRALLAVKQLCEALLALMVQMLALPDAAKRHVNYPGEIYTYEADADHGVRREGKTGGENMPHAALLLLQKRCLFARYLSYHRIKSRKIIRTSFVV